MMTMIGVLQMKYFSLSKSLKATPKSRKVLLRRHLILTQQANLEPQTSVQSNLKRGQPKKEKSRKNTLTWKCMILKNGLRLIA